MPPEKFSFKSFSDSVLIFALDKKLAYPDIIHMRFPVFAYLAEHPGSVVADCSQLEYIDFTGVGFLLELYDYQRRLDLFFLLSNVKNERVLKTIQAADASKRLLFFKSNSQAADFIS